MSVLLRNQSVFLLLCFVLPYLSTAQNCEEAPDNFSTFNANSVAAPMSASGTLWWDGEDNNYSINTPYGSGPNVATLFAAGLWVGGFDPGGNLKIAASRYGVSSGEVDFYPGPLQRGTGLEDPNRGTPTATSCTDWDKVWQVRRYEVEAFQTDYADDSVLQGDHVSIYAWPGRGNPFFAAYNGFDLPADSELELAPFFDADGNGRYNPTQGDYPAIAQSVVQPALISWTVFHDVGLHEETNTPIVAQLEIQHTAWAYDCETHPWLNETVFSSFKLTNVAIESLDSVYLGLWTDPDLGCYTDDYLGSAPSLSTFYVYNEDSVDGVGEACPSGVARFTDTPPVQAFTFLNEDMANFMVFNNAGSVPAPLIGATGPNTAVEYYHYLSGRFRDGTPLTMGGTGYNPAAPISAQTHFAYNGRPADPTAWSMYQENIGVGDRRGLGSVFIPNLLPGAVKVIDVAYSYHHHPDSNHLQNVNLMYDNVAALQTLYTERFQNLCTPRAICEEDCVWAGDANADGIANHYDLLPIMYARDSSGITRNPPVAWMPQAADDWSSAIPTHLTVNNKHADCDGDGGVSIDDFQVTRQHLGFERPDYQAEEDRYMEGPELVFQPLSSNDDFVDLAADEEIRCEIALSQPIAELRGFAFELEYDVSMLAPVEFAFNFGTQEFYVENSYTYYLDVRKPGQIDMAYYQRTGEVNVDQRLHRIPLALRLREDALPNGLPNDTTCIVFKNIVAYNTEGNPLQIGGQTVKLTISEDIMVSSNQPARLETFQLFPNPTHDQLQVRWAEGEVQSYQVYDLNGQLVQAGKGVWQQQMNVDVSELAEGMYFLRLEREGVLMQAQRFIRL